MEKFKMVDSRCYNTQMKSEDDPKVITSTGCEFGVWVGTRYEMFPCDVAKLSKLLDGIEGVLKIPKYYSQEHCEYLIKSIRSLYQTKNMQCSHEDIKLCWNIYYIRPMAILSEIERRFELVAGRWNDSSFSIRYFKCDLCYSLTMLLFHAANVHKDEVYSNAFSNSIEFLWGCTRALNISCGRIPFNIQHTVSKIIGCIGLTDMTKIVDFSKALDSRSLNGKELSTVSKQVPKVVEKEPYNPPMEPQSTTQQGSTFGAWKTKPSVGQHYVVKQKPLHAQISSTQLTSKTQFEAGEYNLFSGKMVLDTEYQRYLIGTSLASALDSVE